ncbi:MAG: hypothetical protein ACPHN0_05080 [Candidatus Poseidoniaceae archaeon]
MRKITAFAILFLLILPLSGCLDEQNRDDDDPNFVEGSGAMATADAEDHTDDVSTNTNDNLMNLEVTRLENVELKWSDLTITLDDDGDGTNQITCSNPGQSSTSDCMVTEILGNGDGFFDVGEKVTISENGVDICSSNPCLKYVKIFEGTARSNLNNNQPVTDNQVFME